MLKKPPFITFPDEYGRVAFDNGDDLREALRAVEGIPNSTYLVKSGAYPVFVFEKLLKMVKDELLACKEPLNEVAIRLLDKAFVTAKEAVEVWKVVPVPYEVVSAPDGSFSIEHMPFNARLPGEFKNKAEVNAALEILIVDGHIQGHGDFCYQGQYFSLCSPIDMKSLPPLPILRKFRVREVRGNSILDEVDFEAGFEPVSDSFFHVLKALEKSWTVQSNSAIDYAVENVANAWGVVDLINTEKLNSGVYDYSDEDDDIKSLRVIFPELSAISDGALYHWAAVYNDEFCFLRGVPEFRDDWFIFFLIGKSMNVDFHTYDAVLAGKFAACFMLHDQTFAEACELSAAAVVYDRELKRLAYRVAKAFKFIASDKLKVDIRGGAVSTFKDFVLGARSTFFKVSNELTYPEGRIS